MKLLIVSLILIIAVVGSIVFGRVRQARKRSLADWAVGGRSLGGLLFWFVNAGEIYTTFAVFGIAGYAWALGAPAYLAFCSVSLSYAIGYWLMPKIWKAGRLRGLITQADFFANRYDSRWLGITTGVIGIGALIVYVQIQLVSLGLIVSLTFDGALSTTASTIVAGCLMVAFVLFAGLRSAAFAAAVKDILMIVLVVVLAWTVADAVGASSLIDIFTKAEAAHPGIGKFPGLDLSSPTTSVWLMTSAINIALGNWVFPHLFQVSYSANSATSIRRNAIWQPIYSLAFGFIILLGFAALVAGTQPPDGNMNAVLLQFVTDKYPQWVIGLLAGTGFLLALAPGSVLLLTAGSIFGRNIVAPFKPQLSEKQSLRISRTSVVVFAAIAVAITLTQKGSLVSILLSAYSAIGMLAPGVFLGFLWRRTSAAGVVCGIIVGFMILLLPSSSAYLATALPNWEPGLIAMLANALVVMGVSVLTKAPSAKHVELGLMTPAGGHFIAP
ncbi:sodium:solute symporter family protein [Pseudomonas trivialis]|uniref:Sodium:solute symporter family protein n=1 Tax=Pseudomonas salomonii TaxID=191391 RepID=A0ABS9GI48_9PSED|nr:MULTISPECIES: sodium:solute symporter family protein [Pseudomonas]AVJ38242.1 sodium:solute symporter [Pseudomonas lurida]MBC3239475.1 sodium:solute symporter family protein [Pseudomonas lurida]MCF5544272.1 sodium:solute symporter family protein [Pseudomonas salomonii]PRA17857.1 sodium:solute symporter [Pseudomonas sp. MYb13]PRA20991.1 sodium:solute symporter [Pseudomonas lurida]